MRVLAFFFQLFLPTFESLELWLQRCKLENHKAKELPKGPELAEPKKRPVFLVIVHQSFQRKKDNES